MYNYGHYHSVVVYFKFSPSIIISYLKNFLKTNFLSHLILIYRVETIDGTAVVEEDYIKINEVITFEAGETEKEVCFKKK